MHLEALEDCECVVRIEISYSYTMSLYIYLPVRGDNPRVSASELPYVQMDKHSITNLYHLHFVDFAHHTIFRAKPVRLAYEEFCYIVYTCSL